MRGNQHPARPLPVGPAGTINLADSTSPGGTGILPPGKDDFLQDAYRFLRTTYAASGLEPGALMMLGIKPEWTAVLADRGQAGVALNFTGEHAVGGSSSVEEGIEEMRRFVGRSLFDLAEALLARPDSQSRAICLAVLNALSNPLTEVESMKKRGLQVETGNLRTLVGPADKVALVGYGGFVRHFVGKAGEVHVTDLRPPENFRSLLIGKEVSWGPEVVKVHPAQENKSVLSSAQAVMLTGSTLVNGSFAQLLGWSARARVRGVYGPSAALVPELFLSRGVNFILSYRIRDLERFEFDLVNDLDMEVGLDRYQDCYHIYA